MIYNYDGSCTEEPNKPLVYSLEDLEAGIRAERELCALIAEAGGCDCNFAPCDHDEAGKHIAGLIRSRKP